MFCSTCVGGVWAGAGLCTDSDPALCVRRSAQQSDGPWFCSAVSLWTVRGRGPGAPRMAPQWAPSAIGQGRGGVERWESRRRGVPSYMAQGLDGTGFGSGACQAVPHGGRRVGGWVQSVLVSQREHHGVGLRERGRDGLHSTARFTSKYDFMSANITLRLHTLFCQWFHNLHKFSLNFHD